MPQDITGMALVVEIGLAGVAIAVGWFIGRLPTDGIDLRGEMLAENVRASAIGFAATLPMLAMLLVLGRMRFGPFLRLNHVVEEWVVPLFSKTTIVEMALISAAAGLGEEMLFRGLMQATIAAWWTGPYPVVVGLVVASVVFGVCHWITPTYAVLATVIGLYLGWLFIITQNNLLAPIVAHGLYDFIALVYLVRWKNHRTVMPSSEHEKRRPDQN